MSKQDVKFSETSPLQRTWNGIFKEYESYRSNTLGRILTIIDSVIVNEKQNKSIKDLIRNAIWDQTETETNMAHWFYWLDENNGIEKRGSCGSAEPMQYDGPPVGHFKIYK